MNKHFKRAMKDNLFTFVCEFIRLGVNPADVFRGETRYDQFINDLYDYKVVVGYQQETFDLLLIGLFCRMMRKLN